MKLALATIGLAMAMTSTPTAPTAQPVEKHPIVQEDNEKDLKENSKHLLYFEDDLELLEMVTTIYRVVTVEGTTKAEGETIFKEFPPYKLKWIFDEKETSPKEKSKIRQTARTTVRSF